MGGTTALGGGEAVVVGPCRAAHRCLQPLPLLVITHGEDGPAVVAGARVATLRRAGGVTVAERRVLPAGAGGIDERSEEHTSELQSLMRISYAVFCLKKKTKTQSKTQRNNT